MLNDSTIKLLGTVAVALHLGAPVVGWWIGSMRWPIGAVVTVTAAVTLGLMVSERPSPDPVALSLAAIHILALGGGLWWLLSPAPPAAAVAWLGYALVLLWLIVLMTYMLTFQLDRLW